MGLTFVLQLLESLPSLIQAGHDVSSLIASSTTAVKQMQTDKRDPTPAEWDALNSQLMALRQTLHEGE